MQLDIIIVGINVTSHIKIDTRNLHSNHTFRLNFSHLFLFQDCLFIKHSDGRVEASVGRVEGFDGAVEDLFVDVEGN